MAACKDVYFSAALIKPTERDVHEICLSVTFTLMLSKEVRVVFSVSRLFFDEQRRRSGAAVLLVCDSSVWGLGGEEGGGISCCLASERVKGSGREA